MADDDRIRLTDRQKKAQRARSIAIALALIAFVVMIYLVTVVKMGPALFNRPL